MGALQATGKLKNALHVTRPQHLKVLGEQPFDAGRQIYSFFRVQIMKTCAEAGQFERMHPEGADGFYVQLLEKFEKVFVRPSPEDRRGDIRVLFLRRCQGICIAADPVGLFEQGNVVLLMKQIGSC